MEEIATFYQNRAAAYEQLVNIIGNRCSSASLMISKLICICATHTSITFHYVLYYYELQKKYNAVKMDCTKAIELNPKYTKALLRRSRALEQLGELESAFEDVTTTCIYENFTNVMTLQLADKLLKQLGMSYITHIGVNLNIIDV